MKLDRCLVCDSDQLETLLNLGRSPLANTYLKQPAGLTEYELKINYCNECTHCQLSEAVDPNLLYKDYKYVSSTTETLKKHFENLEQSFHRFSHCDPVKTNILDIGCNDGSLLQEFKNCGFNVLGIDPAENLREITKSKNIPVIVDYWSYELAEDLLKLGNKFHLITALNCLAHNSNPVEFLKACRLVLDDNGVVEIEFPYWGNTLRNQDFGQVYHEHHSYFTIQSFSRLCHEVGFIVYSLEEFPDLHGGTIKFILRKSSQHEQHCVTFSNLLFKEEEFNIRDSLIEFNLNLKLHIGELKESILLLKNNGCNIVAYSASAKSSTLFNLPQMKDYINCIDFVVDDNPLKQGLYCPGSNLEIKKPEALTQVDNLVILLTVHNFKKEVISRLKRLGLKNITILNYTPHVLLEEIF